MVYCFLSRNRTERSFLSNETIVNTKFDIPTPFFLPAVLPCL